MKKISMVVSVYNEEQGLKEFYKTADSELRSFISSPEGSGFTYDFWFVNDGSLDGTKDILKELREHDREKVKTITFSRNFGHEAAMCAGLDYAEGDYLIFLDADLQHPPSLVPQIVEAFEGGAEVISMVRLKNKTAGKLKNVTSSLFYSSINKLSSMHLEPSASDFFAMDKKAADVLRKNYREKIRFLRGYVQNIGFKKAAIPYEAAPRVAGDSHYSIKKLIRLALDTIVCFSDIPLKAGIYAGFFSGLIGLAMIIYTLCTRRGAPSGYATIVIVLCFMFAVLFFILGIIGKYIAVIYTEMKDRPIYIVDDIEN